MTFPDKLFFFIAMLVIGILCIPVAVVALVFCGLARLLDKAKIIHADALYKEFERTKG